MQIYTSANRELLLLRVGKSHEENWNSLLKQAAPPVQSTKSDEELKSARLRLEEGDRDALKLEYADMIMAAEDSKKRAEEVEDYIAIQEAEERIAP